MSENTVFELGQVVRCGAGKNDLLEIQTVNQTQVKPYYYGLRADNMAGSATHFQCTIATTEERQHYYQTVQRLKEAVMAKASAKPLSYNAVKSNIAECKDIALRNDAQAVVIMRVERDGTVNLSTYGEDKYKCDVIGEWAQNSIWAQVARVPFEVVFGHNKGGVQTALEMREYMGLTPSAKAYYDRILPKSLRSAPKAEPDYVEALWKN